MSVKSNSEGPIAEKKRKSDIVKSSSLKCNSFHQKFCNHRHEGSIAGKEEK